MMKGLKDFIWTRGVSKDGNAVFINNTGSMIEECAITKADIKYMEQTTQCVNSLISKAVLMAQVFKTPGIYLLVDSIVFCDTLNPLCKKLLAGKILISDVSLLDAYCNLNNIEISEKNKLMRSFVEKYKEIGYGYVIVGDIVDSFSSAIKMLTIASSVKDSNGNPFKLKMIYNRVLRIITLDKRSKVDFEATVCFPEMITTENIWQQLIGRVSTSALYKMLAAVASNPNAYIAS